MRNAGKKMLYSEFGIALKYVIPDSYRCSRGCWMLSRIHSAFGAIRKEIREHQDQSIGPLVTPIFPKTHRGPWEGNYVGNSGPRWRISARRRSRPIPPTKEFRFCLLNCLRRAKSQVQRFSIPAWRCILILFRYCPRLYAPNIPSRFFISTFSFLYRKYRRLHLANKGICHVPKLFPSLTTECRAFNDLLIVSRVALSFSIIRVGDQLLYSIQAR